jgi:hypothetical protein
MMININIVGGEKAADGKLIGASITGSADGKTFGVKYTKEKYDSMTALALSHLQRMITRVKLRLRVRTY